MRLLLPVAEDSRKKPADSKNFSDDHTASNLSILMVEDNPQLSEIVSEYLNEAGASFHLASSIRETIEFLESNSGEMDVIVSDIHLPDGNGIEVVELCRQKWPDALVILVTGYSTVNLRELENLDNCSLLQKPFQLSVLWEMIHSKVNQSAGPQESDQRDRIEVLENIV